MLSGQGRLPFKPSTDKANHEGKCSALNVMDLQEVKPPSFACEIVFS